MAAKVELEAYVNDEHPHPQYLRHHISSFDTSVKQLADEGLQLVSDGFPQDMDRKDFCSPNVGFVNGHTDTNMKTGAHPNIMPGNVFSCKLQLILA